MPTLDPVEAPTDDAVLKSKHECVGEIEALDAVCSQFTHKDDCEDAFENDLTDGLCVWKKEDSSSSSDSEEAVASSSDSADDAVAKSDYECVGEIPILDEACG